MKMNLGLEPSLGPTLLTKLKSNGPDQLEGMSRGLCEAPEPS